MVQRLHQVYLFLESPRFLDATFLDRLDRTDGPRVLLPRLVNSPERPLAKHAPTKVVNVGDSTIRIGGGHEHAPVETDVPRPSSRALHIIGWGAGHEQRF